MIALPAHLDSERIYLDEPFHLEPNMKLIVTILPELESDNEYEAWLNLSGRRLENAYRIFEQANHEPQKLVEWICTRKVEFFTWHEAIFMV
jgi:hypothetical protein